VRATGKIQDFFKMLKQLKNVRANIILNSTFLKKIVAQLFFE
jgi:hypothetical protein